MTRKAGLFFLQRKEEKNALRSKKKWFRWHFPPLQKAKIRGVKGRMNGKNEEFLDIFCQDSSKKARKTGVERRRFCAF